MEKMWQMYFVKPDHSSHQNLTFNGKHDLLWKAVKMASITNLLTFNYGPRNNAQYLLLSIQDIDNSRTCCLFPILNETFFDL